MPPPPTVFAVPTKRFKSKTIYSPYESLARKFVFSELGVDVFCESAHCISLWVDDSVPALSGQGTSKLAVQSHGPLTNFTFHLQRAWTVLA